MADISSYSGASISGGNPGHMSSTFLENMLRSGALQSHIREKLIPCYAQRYYAMVNAIKEHLEPLGVKIDTGKPYPYDAVNADRSKTLANGVSSGEQGTLAGGFFLLITLPKGVAPASSLAKIAMEEHDLKFAYGAMFEVKGDETSRERSKAGLGSSIRLCWSFHEETAIVEGIKRLKEILIQQGVQITSAR